MGARLYCWCIRHPRLARPLMVTALMELAALTATAAAPPAFASSNAAALDWTGVKDAQGVPIGSYYLATVSLSKQLTDGAPQVNPVNPATWFDWVDKVSTRLIDAAAASMFLTAEAGVFIALLAIAVWLYRLAAKSVWVTFFATLARPFVDAMVIAVNKAGLLLWLLPIAVFAGGWTVIKGAAGRGWMMILSAFAVATVGVLLLSDPVALMYGDHGLLATGRGAAFEVAEVAMHNGAISGAHAARDDAGQLEVFTGDLMSAVARRPFQVWQYGHTLSGRCDLAWGQTMLAHPSEDAPIKAVQACGDLEAARYASDLNGNNAWLGLLLCGSAFVFTSLVFRAAGALVMVPARAMYRVVKAPVEIYVGIPEGPGRAWMLHALKQFGFMFVEMFVYTLFVCAAGMVIARIVTNPLPADLGGTNPVAKILVFGASSWVMIGLFHTIRAELFGIGHRQGMVSRLGWSAAGAAASLLGARAGGAVLKRVQNQRARRESPPWEDLDSKISEVAKAVGGSGQGLDTISAATSGDGDRRAGAQSPVAVTAARRPVPNPSALSRPAPRTDRPTAPDGRRANRRAPVVAGRRARPAGGRPDPAGDGSQLDTISGSGSGENRLQSSFTDSGRKPSIR